MTFAPAMLLLIVCALWATSLTPYHLNILYNADDRSHCFCVWREPVQLPVPMSGSVGHIPFPFTTESFRGRLAVTRITPVVKLPAKPDLIWPGLRILRTDYDDGAQGGTMDWYVIYYWLLAVPLALVCGFQVLRFSKRRRIVAGKCFCGYDLRATPDRCPECGLAVARASGT